MTKTAYARTRSVPPWTCRDADATNLSLATTAVLLLLARAPQTPRYGYELSRMTGYSTAYIFNTLTRFHKRGWLDRFEQDVASSAPATPGTLRVYYRLTPHGVEQVRRVRDHIRALALLTRESTEIEWENDSDF